VNKVAETSNSTTIDACAVSALAADAAPRITLVFRWEGGSEAVDFERARALTIGRGASCDVRIEDPSLSRQHARFIRERDGVRVEDLGARNGVAFRGRQVKSISLASGDHVALGRVTVSVYVLGHEPSAEERATDSVSAAQKSAEAADSMVWAGARMTAVLHTVERAARTRLPILVRGETGTGKELVALEIHRRSPRSAAPLRVVNCGAIPATLVESALFGHERGAFTGADRPHPGIFEQANGGSVFLDEIGELSLAAQAALLRVLETGCFNRVGATREIKVDVRVIAATHRDLDAMVAAHAFRLDLLHRLDGITIELPPLRERGDELPALIEHFLGVATRAWKVGPKYFDDDALDCLRQHAWPGNVRELRNVVERAVAISDGQQIGVQDLPERLRRSSIDRTPLTVEGTATVLSREERRLIVDALRRAQGNRREAAALLGMSLRTLERRIQRYEIGRSASRDHE
jgi:DNA-binding NtrC family response regulator